MKSSQGFEDGTYREQDMEQLAMAAGVGSSAEESPVTDIGCVPVACRYTGFVL
jgi:hypothetical protein